MKSIRFSLFSIEPTDNQKERGSMLDLQVPTAETSRIRDMKFSRQESLLYLESVPEEGRGGNNDTSSKTFENRLSVANSSTKQLSTLRKSHRPSVYQLNTFTRQSVGFSHQTFKEISGRQSFMVDQYQNSINLLVTSS